MKSFLKICLNQPTCFSPRGRQFVSNSNVSSRVVSVSDVIGRQMDTGELRHDVAQKESAHRLSKLQIALEMYDNSPLVDYFQELEKLEVEERQTTKATSHKREDDAESTTVKTEVEENNINSKMPPPPSFKIPRGLYIFGDVGTGKSMLMDTFYAALPQCKKRRRVHFHAFMQDVHERIHDLKQQDLREKGRNFHVDTSEVNNPVVRVAKNLAKELSLLCFDEFQVTDVADALILRQLFTVLFQYGTVVVATSNRPPSDLYEGGINRSYFLPFVDILERHCIIHELQSNLDYRMILSQGMDSFFFVRGLQIDSESKIDETFRNLLNGTTEKSIKLKVRFQRSLIVERAHPSGLVARFSFEELCRRYIGSADYQAIAKYFQVILIKNIPRLNLKKHDEARRFITLIDELYENKCALMCSADYSAEELFLASYHDEDSVTEVELKVGERFGVDVAQSNGMTVNELASVKELEFAFRRASSRLIEMCSKSWWNDVLK
eukprot:CAMPEP_0194230178 /NCGR_PEP_ID=MMETSP0156-20130528/44274_1 /TAXON_ID=33649 /ORGANISM="Thalassionema nitzschioides, Strain L26-B" /LENGTH=493 /DNA_ID=CAMNT_0038962753 /DNA_START=3 /DNA_END=1484 /DNA_ORIENTATION=+